jgi:hypothetical protein
MLFSTTINHVNQDAIYMESSKTSPPGPAETAASRASSDIGGFKCDICGTPFPSSEELDRHKEQAHK